MFHKYNFHWNGRRINSINCKKYTGYKQIELLALTGVFALYGRYSSRWKSSIRGNYPFVIVEIYSELYCVCVKIDTQRLEIENVYIEVTKPCHGYGLRILTSQIREASAVGLERLRLRAIRGMALNGYITWWKLGYTIHDDAFSAYDEFLEQHKIEQQSLEMLLASHLDFWVLKGKTFEGVFYLTKKSENRQILKRYLKRKLRSKAKSRIVSAKNNIPNSETTSNRMIRSHRPSDEERYLYHQVKLLD